MRTMLDVIVQSCTVELFRLWDLPVAPVRHMQVSVGQHRYEDLVGVVRFEAPRFSGALTLSLESSVLDGMIQVPTDARRRQDWVREAANQLIGRLKNRLINFQVTLHVGLPTAMSGRALEVKHRTFDTISVYLFRTVRGKLVVTLEGDIQPQALVYTGATLVPGEGEFIEFD